jgi:hypothetical protein
MKQIRLGTKIAALGLFFLLALAACETPTDPGLADDGGGPEDGTEWIFENQSSHDIGIYPDNEDPHPEQGWNTFSLPAGESRTVRVNTDYDAIYFRHTRSDLVTPERIEGENRVVFKDSEEPAS